MPQALAKNLIHLVYSTKHRNPWITTDAQWMKSGDTFKTRQGIIAG